MSKKKISTLSLLVLEDYIAFDHLKFFFKLSYIGIGSLLTGYVGFNKVKMPWANVAATCGCFHLN